VKIAELRSQLSGLGFSEAAFGRRRLYISNEIAGYAESIHQQLSSIHPGTVLAAGNRRSAVAVTITGLPPIYVRRYRRGGLMRFLVSELYTGPIPRPLHELVVTGAAYKRGLPVVEPIGAGVETAGPLLYRGWFLTRALEGTTLWNLLLSNMAPEQRHAALAQARATIDRLHEGGVYHADLNLHNLFVCTGEQPLRVVALDLDKARLYPTALTLELRRANFNRLARSAQKLTQSGAALTAEERTMVGI
jgi:3-deoxy-D-manno-octulosonic acid kinase